MHRLFLGIALVVLPAFGAAVVGTSPSGAQGDPPLSELLLPRDGETAVDSPLGRSWVTSFADALLESADPTCKDNRKLDAEQYRTQARALFLSYFPNVRKHIAERINSEGFRVGFERAFGQGSLAAWRAMLKTKEMGKRLEVLEPRTGEWVINELVEQIYQTDVVGGHAISKAFGPMRSGDPALLTAQQQVANEVDAKLKALEMGRQDEAAARFDEMFDGVMLAALRAGKHEPTTSAWVMRAPRDIIPNLPARLEAICVKR